MPPKQRDKKNKPHPKGWRWKNGAWRYRVPSGQESEWDGRVERKAAFDEYDYE